MSRISKSKFILLNLFLFLLPFGYLYLNPTDKFDGDEGYFNYIAYIFMFAFGLFFYAFKYDKISKEKDIENDTMVFITNTLILVVFALTIINFDMFFFYKVMSFMFLIGGNFFYWIGKYIAILKYENGVQFGAIIHRKHQKWYGLSWIIMGIISYILALVLNGYKIPGLIFTLAFLFFNRRMLKYYVIKTARKEELYS